MSSITTYTISVPAIKPNQTTLQELWTPTGIQVAPGDQLTINTSGTVNFWSTSSVGPNGFDRPSSMFLAPELPTLSLIGRVGQDSPFFVGSELSRTVRQTGELYLAFNDESFQDNSGAFSVEITLEKGAKMPENGLVLHLPLSQLNNQTLRDESGNGLDATIIGNPQIVQDPEFGPVLEFNGIGDSAEVPENEKLNQAAKHYTVQVWIKPMVTQGLFAIVGKPGRNYNIWLCDGEINHYFKIKDNYSRGLGEGPRRNLRIGEWHQITIWNNGSQAKTYINGMLEKDLDCRPPLVEVSKLIIGKDLDGGNAPYFFRGRMAQIKIYDRPLSEQEIQFNYYRDQFNSLMGYWIFEPGISQTDRMGNFARLSLKGAYISHENLRLRFGGYACADMYVGSSIREKTLVTQFVLNDLEVSAGSILNMDQQKGVACDQIDYTETDAGKEVTMAVTYRDAGNGQCEVTSYRNGEPVGSSVQGPLKEFQPGETELLFGASYYSLGIIQSNPQLDASVKVAMLFNQALTQEEIRKIKPFQRTFDASKDFADKNPNGVWSYGKGRVGGDLTPFPHYPSAWMTGWNTEGGSWHSILKNNLDYAVQLTTELVMQPQDLVMVPGEGDAPLTKLRFTAPQTAHYRIDAKWTTYNADFRNVDIMVYTNSEEATGLVPYGTPPGFKQVFNKRFTGNAKSDTYKHLLFLREGQIISFELGDGGDTFHYDVVKTEVKIFLED